MFWYFSCFIFLSEKPLVYVPHVLTNGRHLHHSSGAYVAARWSNLVIRHLLGSVAVHSFTLCDTCGRIMIGLSPVIDCLCFFFLFSLLTTKMHNCHICLLFVNFSSHSLNFLFRPYFFYKSLVFSKKNCLSITIS